MRPAPNPRVEPYRDITGVYSGRRSTPSDGNNGLFLIPYLRRGHTLAVIASDGMGWEHVSISIAGRRTPPIWEEMAFIKDLFWGEEETVIQYHPPKSRYINNFPGCLHLWKPIGVDLPLPAIEMVGIPGFEG